MMRVLISTIFLYLVIITGLARAGIYREYSSASGLLSNNIEKIDSYDSVIYILSDAGLQYFDGEFHELVKTSIDDFTIKGLNEIYYITSNGLYYLKDNQSSNIKSGSYKGVIYLNGTLYLYSGDKIFALDDGGSALDTFTLSDINKLKVAGDTVVVLTTSGAYNLDGFVLISEENVLDIIKKDNYWIYSTTEKIVYDTILLDSVGADYLVNIRDKVISGGNTGAHIYDLITKTKVAVLDEENVLADETITSLKKDIYGNIWLGTGQSGVYVFTPSVEYITKTYNTLGLTTNLLGDIVDNISVFGDSVWFSYSNVVSGYRVYAGAGFYDLSRAKLKNYSSANSILTDTVYCFEKYNGLIYIGTDSGLFKYESNKIKFVGLGEKTIRALKSFNSKLYIGADSIFYSFDGTDFDTVTYLTDDITDFEDNGQDIFIATTSGLSLFSISTDTIAQEYSELSGKYVLAINKMTNSKFYIGTLNYGLYELDDGQMIQIGYAHDTASPDYKAVYDISIDTTRAEMWIANSAGGLCYGNLSAGYYYNLTTEQGLNSNIVISAATDGERVFIGTYGGGLNIYYPEYSKPILRFVEVPMGRYVVYPYSIEIDNQGRVKYNGLVRVSFYAFDYFTPTKDMFYDIQIGNPIRTTSTSGEISISAYSQGALLNLGITAYNRFYNQTQIYQSFRVYFFDIEQGLQLTTDAGNFSVYLPPNSMSINTKIGFVDSATDSSVLKVMPEEVELDAPARIEWSYAADNSWAVYRDDVLQPSFVENNRLVFYITTGGQYNIKRIAAPQYSTSYAFSVKITPRVLTSDAGKLYFQIKTSVGETIEAIVFDSLGHLIKKLYEGESYSGNINVSWDGRDEQGTKVTNGLYILYIKGEKDKIKKVFGVRW